MDCSLSKFYRMLWEAIGLLALAIAGALIPLNIIGLVASVASVATVSFVLIPAMREELKAYDTCMGPTQSCSVGPNIDLLGQLASILSLVAFAAALALEIPAIAALASVFLAWLGVTLEAAASALKYSGCVACGAGILILLGLLTNVDQYESCREKEPRDISLPIGSSESELSSTPSAKEK
jgi:hypothetical protein